MERIGIELLSVFGLPPVQFVELVADLGCRYLSTGLTAAPINPHGYPIWSLRDDAALRRDMIAAMLDRNVSISLGEGFAVRPNVDIRERAADLELMRELGAARINTVSLEPDLNRTLDQLGTLVDMVDALGLQTTLEFGPGLGIATLPAALAAISDVGRPNLRLLIDTMHLVRSGSGAADIAALDPALIGYIQLSDVPLISTHASYMEEAMFARMAPGSGELPLRDILVALPQHLPIGLEVPQRAPAERGIGPRDRLAPCVEATRAMLGTLAS
jgi:sugar phosphate isomerase/epimerase